ncbi:MAG: carboxypeptidase-like regulatory domain-containing protein [Gemmatimonadetes bacterium]|nr:carboxypeptidase-like regulatory domain-containing protein [Gemmatimonadota bacterium]
MIAGIVTCTAATTGRVHAQAGPRGDTATSVFTGRILDARSERPVVDASILLPMLDRSARSDSTGRIRVSALPAGKHIALVRAVGYDSLLFAIDVARNDTAEADLLLTPLVAAGATPPAQQLAKVKVEATGGVMAARMAEFEDRRKTGFGKFLDSTAFAQMRRRPLADVLGSRIAGVGVERPTGGAAFLVARRGSSCRANVIVDGISLGAYDLTLIDPDEVLAVEYHTVATVPLKYRNTSIGGGGSAACGTLIVWRK